MINQIAEKLITTSGLEENDIYNLNTLGNEVNSSLNEAMNIAIENVENSELSTEEKNKRKEVIHANIKSALILDFIINCKEKAKEHNLPLEEYIEVLDAEIKKSLSKARAIKITSILILAATFILYKVIVVPPRCIMLKLLTFSTVTVGTLMLGFMTSNKIADKLKAISNLINEARKQLNK